MRCVMKTCAFTGNRPDKLPWGYDENDARCRRVKREIYLAAKQAVNDGYNRFICGMAQGGDTYFAEAVLALKAEYDVTLECAVPYRRQSLSWSDAAKKRYERILALADKVTVFEEHYTPWCYHRRNRYMVDSAQRLIALSRAQSGGTKYTIEYAVAKNIEIIYVDCEKKS